MTIVLIYIGSELWEIFSPSSMNGRPFARSRK